MTYDIDLFWEIFESVSGGTGNIPTTLDSIAKSDRTKIENYFSSTIDQVSFSTVDYNRFRKFLIDLFATHRALATSSVKSTDPRSLSNTNLDELFRSFGYPHSSQLKDFTENPLEQKIQLFLDLVNLYKVKGTPQSLVDVLQYYGVTQVDIYEFFLHFYESTDNLEFEGKAVAGTSVNPIDLRIVFENLVGNDPHWLYTRDQILDLFDTNKINFPSKSPYIGVQPVIELERPEMSIISRIIQDQYLFWSQTGDLPLQNAQITILGEIASFLELYLLCVYIFNKLYTTGVEDVLFTCYNGTNTVPSDIVEEFDNLVQGPFTRETLKSSYEEYLNLFTRLTSTNFFVDENIAEELLTIISPQLKESIDNIVDLQTTLFSLFKDLSEWIRLNIGSGFVNFGFILFGVSEFFNELKPVIDFFKPYRARLVLLESLQINNRLLNSLIVEDEVDLYLELLSYDYVTADSIPCCGNEDLLSPCDETITQCRREFVITPPENFTWKGLWQLGTNYIINDVVSGTSDLKQYICIQNHTSSELNNPPFSLVWSVLSEIFCYDTTGENVSYYSRDLFDCGSYFDIGASSDIMQDFELEITDTYWDPLRCPYDDGTGFVYSEVTDTRYSPQYILPINLNSSTKVVGFDVATPDTSYIIGSSLNNNNVGSDIFTHLVTYKTTTSFAVSLSGPVTNSNYNLEWFIDFDTTNSGIISLVTDQTYQLVEFLEPQDSTSYVVSLVLTNTIDPIPEIFSYQIVNKTSNSFLVMFSSPISTDNYKLEWIIPATQIDDIAEIPYGSSSITVPINNPQELLYNNYPLLVNIDFSDEVPLLPEPYKGELYVWGRNYFGEFGLGEGTARSSPTLVGSYTDWITLAFDRYHSLLIRNDGTLWSCGYNTNGQLGHNDSFYARSSPVQVGSDTDWSQVQAGEEHSLAIKTDGTLWSWGRNNTGQLGLNSSIYLNRSSPTQVGSDTDWNKISASSYLSCSLKNNGTLWTWGDNTHGQLGQGDTIRRSSPVQVGSDADWVEISAGSTGGAGIKSNGTVWTWGRNINGQLAQGDIINRSSPTQVGSDTNWEKVFCGSTYSFFIKTDGTLWSCGGISLYGELGHNDRFRSKSSPVQVGSDTNWNKIDITHGGTGVAGTKTDGTLWTWGQNTWGQLGRFVDTNRSVPTQVGSDSGWFVVAGGNIGFMVLRTEPEPEPELIEGSLFSFGSNSSGALGQNDIINRSSPVQVGSDTNWNQVSVGELTNLCIKSDGTLWSWGINTYGQLGHDDIISRSSPVQVGSDTDWNQVSINTYYHALGIKNDGTLWSWGRGSLGPLGHGDVIDRSTPTQVGLHTDWTQIAIGSSYSLALRSNGSLWAWGSNGSGRLGLNDTTARSSPVQVGSDTDWSFISTLNYTSLALKTDGTLWSWGDNSYGELGLGTGGIGTHRSSPTQIGSDTDWSQISNGINHSLAIKDDGTLWSWGMNFAGELGHDDTVFKSSPTQVSFGEDSTDWIQWSQITAGSELSFALKVDGSFWAWGDNTNGWLGIDDKINRSTPTQIGLDTDWKLISGGFYHTLAIKEQT